VKKKPAKKKAQKRGVDKRKAFLKAFVACASLTEAAAAVGIDRSAHYDWLKEPKYAEAFERARLEAAQTLEDDAVAWARKGIFEPLVYQGQFQYAQRKRIICTLPDGREVYEDDLTREDPNFDLKPFDIQSRRTVLEDYGLPLGIFRRSEGLMGRLLKAFMPQRYADRGALELTGKDGGPLEIVERLQAGRQRIAAAKEPADK
jgi:hypothetical protein